ncbi:MAG: hypothetical protein EBS55_08555 [Flavobacteriaceae bacterium]|nr:hypothetical protein [Flavobacteriaceae bacterium]
MDNLTKETNMFGTKLSQDDEVKAKLGVLDEIKALLDERLVDKMRPKSVEVSKVEVEPRAEMEMKEEMGDEDKEELQKIYSKLLG